MKEEFDKIIVKIDDSFDLMAYRLAIFARNTHCSPTKRFFARLEWEEYDPSPVCSIPREHQILLSHENPNSRATIQSMMDQLWLMGIRPTQTIADASDVRKEHIEDLRSITYQLLNKVAGKENAR